MKAELKASDLRVGNFVTDEFYDSFKTIHTVGSIDSKGINLLIEDDGNWPELAQTWIEPEHRFDTLRGIPLSEEWLLKFGFELSEDLGDMKYYEIPKNRSGYGVQLDHEEWVFYRYTVNGETALIYDEKHFQYIHQLQNLYFALTGNDLNLKD